MPLARMACVGRGPGPVGPALPAKGQVLCLTASGSHGGGLSLGVAVPSEVGTLTGGPGSSCAFPSSHRLFSFLR